MKKRVLYLTLKKEWFDMILLGINSDPNAKKQEYREFKGYWIKRLMTGLLFKEFDTIVFKNGYASDAREMEVECKGITIDYGLQSWGAVLGVKYFVISLGEILSTKNI